MKGQNKKRVVIISDCKDVAFNEMKWLILKNCFDLGIYDAEVELVAIEEFSILNAAFLSRLMMECCLPGTVISVVINPQKERSARIYGKTSEGIFFFGANTGALDWLIRDGKVQEVWKIFDPGFVSFGGKYVHAPNVAKIIADVPFSEMGKIFPLEKIRTLEVSNGTVVHIDNFGLVKILGDKPNFEEGKKVEIYKNGEYLLDAVFSHRMMSRNDREWVLYAGSSLWNMPEIGTVRYKEGYKEKNIRIGDCITWKV